MMRAVELVDGVVRVIDRPRPELPDGWARVRVRLAGICGTDLELLAGYKGFSGVPGHESMGEVVECPADPALVGERVVGDINVGCGVCGECARTEERHCPERRVLGIRALDGAFAEELVLPVANLHVVPASLSDRQAVFAEPLAAAMTLPRRSGRAAVVGTGRLGALCAQVLVSRGHQVVAVSRHPERVGFLADGGVDVVASTDERFDLVVDTTGSPSGLSSARALVRPRGTLALKSTCAPAAGTAVLDPTDLVVNEIAVIGTRCGRVADAVTMLADGVVDVEALIDETLPLENAAPAFERSARPGAMKILLEIS